MNGFIFHQTVRRTIFLATCLSAGIIFGYHSDQQFILISQKIASMSSKQFGLFKDEVYESTTYSKPVTITDFLYPNRKKEISSNLPKKESHLEQFEKLLAELKQDTFFNENLKIVTKMNNQVEGLIEEKVGMIKSSAEMKIEIQEIKAPQTPAINSGLNEIFQLSNKAMKKLENEKLNIQSVDIQAKRMQIAQKPILEKRNNIVTSSVKINRSSSLTSDCNLLSNIKFNRPIEPTRGEDTQVCPAQKTWISKKWDDQGWVKIDFNQYFSTLIYYPQKTESVLLMDQNSVALFAIKAGLHFSKGTGMILGLVPENFTVDLSGRTDDIQYFTLNQKRYFFILNVDPGPNVVEIINSKNPLEIATVFTPVLDETITYLDLNEPVKENISFKVLKGNKNEDLGNLKVNLSTHTSYQTLTDEEGTGILKNVPLIQGYPIFLDVLSKNNNEKSYQYRFELNKKNKDGIYLLKQINEEKLHSWLKQVKTKLTSHHGMVMEMYDRKKLDGFKNHHFVKTETVTDKNSNISKTFTILWDDQISEIEPLEGDHPRSMSVQVPEGLYQIKLIDESKEVIHSSLIPISSRVISVINE